MVSRQFSHFFFLVVPIFGQNFGFILSSVLHQCLDKTIVYIYSTNKYPLVIQHRMISHHVEKWNHRTKWSVLYRKRLVYWGGPFPLLYIPISIPMNIPVIISQFLYPNSCSMIIQCSDLILSYCHNYIYIYICIYVYIYSILFIGIYRYSDKFIIYYSNITDIF